MLAQSSLRLSRSNKRRRKCLSIKERRLMNERELKRPTRRRNIKNKRTNYKIRNLLTS